MPIKGFLQTFMSILARPEKINFYPLYLQVECTNYCNLHCRFCQRDNMEMKLEHITPENFEFILDEIKPLYLNMGGDGEPLMHPHLDSLIAFAKKRGIMTNFATNGVLLQNYADRLMHSGLDLLKISMDSANPHTFRKIRGMDKYNEIITGLEHLQKIKKQKDKRKPHLRFNVVICRENVMELTEIVMLAHRLGVPTINFKTVDIVGQEEKIPDVVQGVLDNNKLLNSLKNARLAASERDIATNADYLIDNYENYKIRYSPNQISANIRRKLCCYMPWFTTYIKVNGDIAPCCSFALGYVNTSFGNIYSQGVMGALNSQQYVDFRRQMKKGKPSYKLCRYCFEAQTLSNYLVNFKMLRHFFKKKL